MAYNKTPFKMMGKSPMMKALVGKQNNLPDALKEKILASPAKQVEQESSGTTDAMTGKKSPVKQTHKSISKKIGSKKVESKPVTVTEIPKDKVESGYIKKIAKKGSSIEAKNKSELRSEKYKKSPVKKKGCSKKY